MQSPSSYSFASDFVGRINNISLAPSPDNSLAPLFEALTNAIQAIEDKFGKDNLSKGRIEVDVLRPKDMDGKPNAFIISDNGIGFDPTNLQSFYTSDSSYKLKRGGKGVGRFLWLKVFRHAHIDSVYGSSPAHRITFDFALEEQDQIRNLTLAETEATTGSRVTLDSFHAPYAAQCPTKASTIQHKIISHFLSYFINMHAPQIVVNDSGASTDLLDLFSDSVADDRDYTFELSYADNTLSLSLHAFLLPKAFSDDARGYNALYYGANGRTVERHEMDQALGLGQIDRKYIYSGFVESSYLDSIVNQKRTHLAWPHGLFDLVHRRSINTSKEFLAKPIQTIRNRQSSMIEKLRDEHLRFLSIASDPVAFASTLPLSVQRPEDIYLELSRASLRQYMRRKTSFQRSKDRGLPDFELRAKEYSDELKSESLSSLAEYVLKRKLILDVFEERLRFKNIDSESYYFEEAVHEIICPLRETSDTINYDDHNLWIVDDSLAFYTYFASDKTLKSVTGGVEASTQEPDIAIFDLGLGFTQEGSLDPITIIEFKRPGRDDYTLQKNPFVQVREYVTRLRSAGSARGADGREVRQIDEHTPFMCYVVADIEPSLRNMMAQFGPFHRKAGHGCYYKWDEGYRIFIEVASYSEVLKAARARHQAFFVKLGVNA